jgi:hypothetical protein
MTSRNKNHAGTLFARTFTRTFSRTFVRTCPTKMSDPPLSQTVAPRTYAGHLPGHAPDMSSANVRPPRFGGAIGRFAQLTKLTKLPKLTKQMWLLLLLTVSSHAATRSVPCSGDITSALQAAVNASADGDVVSIGSGNCSTTGRISMTDKNITVQGQGKGVTNISAPGGFATINVSGAKSPTWRISGFSLSGTGNNVIIQVWGNHSPVMRGPFRIDHLSLNYPANGSDGMIQIWGPLYGLIDHCDFTMLYEAAILTNLEIDSENCSYNVGGTCTLNSLQGGAGLSIPFDPGGPKNLYVEDCTFTSATATDYFAALDTAYGGGRIVFRHNAMTNVMLYAHWTAGGAVNSLWWEVYNNKFVWNQADNGLYPMRMQGGGTGLIHDNTIVGWPSNFILVGDGRLHDQNQTGPPENFCDGTMSIDGNAGDTSAPGWPCLAQIGRNMGPSAAQIIAGTKQGSYPMYLWNNGAQDKCSNPAAAGSACVNSFSVGTYSASASQYIKSTPHVTSGFGTGDVDYSITASQPAGAGTHSLTYAPYTYPHPLQGGTTTPPTSCALPKYPTPACTGVPPGTALTTVNGDLTAGTNGQVIDGKLITGSLWIAANNVVVKNSRIYGAILNTNGESYTVSDSEIGPLSGCNGNVAMVYENNTATRLHIHNFSDGPRVSGNNVTVQDSFINVCSNPGDHADGIQGYIGGTNVLVSHNTIDERGATAVTAPVFFADNSQSARVKNNLLAGGGYSLRLHDDFTPDHGPWEATGNRIVNAAWLYGPALTTNTECSAATMSWSDNRLVTIDANYNVLTTGAQVNCDGSTSGAPPTSACDLNNDSSTNVSDVQLCANQAIGALGCTTGDINQDSACNVVDVQRVVNGALGGICVTN